MADHTARPAGRIVAFRKALRSWGEPEAQPKPPATPQAEEWPQRVLEINLRVSWGRRLSSRA